MTDPTETKNESCSEATTEKCETTECKDIDKTSNCVNTPVTPCDDAA